MQAPFLHNYEPITEVRGSFKEVCEIVLETRGFARDGCEIIIGVHLSLDGPLNRRALKGNRTPGPGPGSVIPGNASGRLFNCFLFVRESFIIAVLRGSHVLVMVGEFMDDAFRIFRAFQCRGLDRLIIQPGSPVRFR